jgi:hypothetical protein
MKKICHITTAHPFFDTRIFHKEAKSLLNAGYEVFLIAPGERNTTKDGIKIIALQKYSERIRRMTFGVFSAFKSGLRTNATCFHLHDPELMPIGIMLKMFGKKVIYDVHEDYSKQTLSKEYILKPLRKAIAVGIKLTESICSRFFDGIITEGMLNLVEIQ